MNIKHIAGTGSAVVLAALAVSPQVLAQGNSNKPAVSVSLDAKPNPVVFSAVTTISGKVTGENKAGVVIRFEQDTSKPYGDKYTCLLYTSPSPRDS